ncbi:MAG: hypothetical protein U1A72_10540 [Sulfuritalea sp.]|nr:hypothetical protein [Sulfuritalea sp.]
MSSGLELYDSRIDEVQIVGFDARVHFSHAYIRKSKGRPGRDAGSGWSQAALLVIGEAVVIGQLPVLPNTIADGCLQVGGIRHGLLPLPFRRKAEVDLSLVFSDGTALHIAGRGAMVELLGKATYLEDF